MVNGEWSMVNNSREFIDHSPFTLSARSTNWQWLPAKAGKSPVNWFINSIFVLCSTNALFMKILKSLLCILICFWNCSGKPDNTISLSGEVNVTDKDPGYIDFVYAGTKVWAITKDSLLVTFDLANNQKSAIRFNKPIKISAIAKDRQENIVIADTENRLGKYENGNWNFTDTLKGPIKAIFYTVQNEAYLLTDDGILDVKQNKSYLPKRSLNTQLHMPNAFRRSGATTLMDGAGKIWLGYNHGEWGGDIYIFNTKENKFIEPLLVEIELELNPIFSFTYAPDGVFYSGGLSHLFTTKSYIGQFVNDIALVRFSDKIDGLSKDTSKKTGHYVGPICYNWWDDHLYIYTQQGIYKQRPSTKLSKAENWTLVVKPELLWTYGQSNATGYAMNVSKIVAIGPGAFLFLKERTGIGYFNGKELTTLN
jgi:hypothetical protein